MSMSTVITRPDGRSEEEAQRRPAMAEWLLALGPVVHRLDYGGCVAAVGGEPRDVALLRAAHPLAALDVASAGAGDLPAGAYDLVCVLGGVGGAPDPVGSARAALRLVHPTGALVVVEHARSDSFADGPVAVGAWLTRAGAARVRAVAAAPHGFVLDARITP